MMAFFACYTPGLCAVPVFPPRGSKHNRRLESILMMRRDYRIDHDQAMEICDWRSSIAGAFQTQHALQ